MDIVSGAEARFVAKSSHRDAFIVEKGNDLGPNLDLDFIVEPNIKTTPYCSPEIKKESKPKRYFSAKNEHAKEEKQKQITSILKITDTNSKSKEETSSDWILSERLDLSKKTPASRKPTCRNLLFEVYSSDQVFRTLYSTHTSVLDHSSWAVMYEMMSGKFRDGDFEPTMSNIVGHKKVKTDKDIMKLYELDNPGKNTKTMYGLGSKIYFQTTT